ncbi:MAG: hypothetical protein ACFFEK_08160 [Candidatus Thorarchaeota archaeon]
MDSEKKRSDEYWKGVRDSLRMVDSFTKWARRNQSRAKNLDDFIHDGLVAAAKRCESCLKDDLGLTFAEDETADAKSLETESVPPGYEYDSGSLDSSDVETTFDVAPEDMTPGTSEVPIESDSDTISIDNVDRLEEEAMDDLSIDGPPREFTSDFDLVEPTALDIDSTDTSSEHDTTPEPEPEDVEDAETKPSFTWADYEKAVAPTKDDPDAVEDEDDAELPPPIELEHTQTEPEIEPEPERDSVEVPAPPHLPDEPESTLDIEDDNEETENNEPISEPPAPPPPPESDEDEEERRRRARRLFFGD